MMHYVKGILSNPSFTRRVSRSVASEFIFKKSVDISGVASFLSEMRQERDILLNRLEGRIGHQVSPESFKLVSKKLAKHIYHKIQSEKKGKSRLVYMTAKCFPDDKTKELLEEYVELVIYQILGAVALDVDAHHDNSHLVRDLFENIVEITRDEIFGREGELGILDQIQNRKGKFNNKEIYALFNPFLSRIFSIFGYHEADHLPLPRFREYCWRKMFQLISKRLFDFLWQLTVCEEGERRIIWDLSSLHNGEDLMLQCDELAEKMICARGALFEIFFSKQKLARKFRQLFSTDIDRDGYNLEEFLADGVAQCLHHVSELDNSDPICEKLQIDTQWALKFVCRQFSTTCPQSSHPLFLTYLTAQLTHEAAVSGYFQGRRQGGLLSVEERQEWIAHLSELVLSLIYPNKEEDLPVWFSNQFKDFRLFINQIPVFIKDLIEEVSLPAKRNRNCTLILRNVNQKLRGFAIVKPHIMKDLTVGQSKKILEKELSDTLDLYIINLWKNRVPLFLSGDKFLEILSILLFIPLLIWQKTKNNFAQSVVEMISRPEHERLVMQLSLHMVHLLSNPSPYFDEDELRNTFKDSLKQIFSVSEERLWSPLAGYISERAILWTDRKVAHFLRGDDPSKGSLLRTIEILTEIFDRLEQNS